MIGARDGRGIQARLIRTCPWNCYVHTGTPYPLPQQALSLWLLSRVWQQPCFLPHGQVLSTAAKNKVKEKQSQTEKSKARKKKKEGRRERERCSSVNPNFYFRSLRHWFLQFFLGCCKLTLYLSKLCDPLRSLFCLRFFEWDLCHFQT